MSILFNDDLGDRAADRALKAATRRHYERQASSADLVRSAYAEEEDALANMEARSEWESAECAHHADVRTGYVPRDAVELAAHVEAASVPMLVAIRNTYPRAEAVIAAARELDDRYLAHWKRERGIPVDPLPVGEARDSSFGEWEGAQ